MYWNMQISPNNFLLYLFFSLINYFNLIQIYIIIIFISLHRDVLRLLFLFKSISVAIHPFVNAQSFF